MGAGWAPRMLKAFNFVDMPCAIFVIFSTAGFDFVGGFTFYQLFKKNLFKDGGLGKLDL